MEEELLLAQLLAGHRIDDADALLPMNADTMERAWAKLRSQQTLQDGVGSPIIARQLSQPAVEQDYYVPGEDTEASLGLNNPYGKQLETNWSQLTLNFNFNQPYSLSSAAPSSNQLAGFIEVCTKAIEAEPDPQHGGPYLRRALVHERLGQYQQAIADMREWLWRIGPIPNKAFLVRQYFLLGRCFSRVGESEKAETYFQRAQDCSSEDGEACDYVALSYAIGPTNFASCAKALPLALKAVELSKTNPPYATTLAEVYSRLGQPQKATDILEKAIQLHPDSGALTCIKLALYYVNGPKEIQSPQKALPLALKAVELSKSDPLYASVLAEIYLRLGQTQKAADTLETAIQLHPGAGWDAYNNLAWYYVTGPKEIRSPEKALPLALKAVELDKSSEGTLNTLGVVYYRLGQFTNAVEVFKRDSKNQDPLTIAYDGLFLAMSYHRLGETAEAESRYAQAAKWLEENAASLSPQSSLELREFRAEAEELFGKRKNE